MTKKIIIGVDIRDLRIAKTGARTYLEEISREFKKGDAHFEFVFIDSNFPVYTGKNKFLKLLEHIRFQIWKQVVLPLKAKQKKCHILFCTDYFVPYFRMGLITIPVFHDTFFWEYPSHYNKYWLYLFHSLGVRAAKKSFCIVTPSFYVKKQVSFYTALPDSKIIPVYEAPKSVLHFEQHRATDNNDLNVTLSFPYLLHVGTFEKRKNLSILIEAFEQIHQKQPALKLILIGQASPKESIDDYAHITQMIKEKNLVSSVQLPGYVSDDQLHYYYKNALLYVFPSRNEGFGIPVLEAFAYGLPVIIANNSCLPEIGGNAAVSFDVDSKEMLCEVIETFYNNPTLRESFGIKGKKRLEEFSWEKTATELKHIFRKAFDEKYFLDKAPSQ